MKKMKKMSFEKKSIILVTNFCVLWLMIALIIYSNFKHSNADFVTFDMKASVKAFEQQLSQTNLSQDQQSKLISTFLRYEKQDADDYAQKHKVVILVNGAVVSGQLPDITHDIQEELAPQIKSVWPTSSS